MGTNSGSRAKSSPPANQPLYDRRYWENQEPTFTLQDNGQNSNRTSLVFPTYFTHAPERPGFFSANNTHPSLHSSTFTSQNIVQYSVNSVNSLNSKNFLNPITTDMNLTTIHFNHQPPGTTPVTRPVRTKKPSLKVREEEQRLQIQNRKSQVRKPAAVVSPSTKENSISKTLAPVVVMNEPASIDIAASVTENSEQNLFALATDEELRGVKSFAGQTFPGIPVPTSKETKDLIARRWKHEMQTCHQMLVRCAICGMTVKKNETKEWNTHDDYLKEVDFLKHDPKHQPPVRNLPFMINPALVDETGNFLACEACNEGVNANKMPKLSYANGRWRGLLADTPLNHMTKAELSLVKLYHPKMYMYFLRSVRGATGGTAFRGSVTSFPLDSQAILGAVTTLPHDVGVLPQFYRIFITSPNTSLQDIMKKKLPWSMVCREAVHKGIRYLIEVHKNVHGPHRGYGALSINEHNLNQLPETRNIPDALLNTVYVPQNDKEAEDLEVLIKTGEIGYVPESNRDIEADDDGTLNEEGEVECLEYGVVDKDLPAQGNSSSFCSSIIGTICQVMHVKHGSQPVGFFGEDDYWHHLYAWPEIFPYALGAPGEKAVIQELKKKRKDLSLDLYFKALYLEHDEKVNNSGYRYFTFNELRIKNAYTKTAIWSNKHFDAQFAQELSDCTNLEEQLKIAVDMLEKRKAGEKGLKLPPLVNKLINKVKTVGKHVAGSYHSHVVNRSKCFALCFDKGPPHIWGTISPYKGNALVSLKVGSAPYNQVNIDFRVPLVPLSSKQVHSVSVGRPDAVWAAYKAVRDAFIKCILGWDVKSKRPYTKGGLFGYLEWFALSTEAQKQDAPHAHYLARILGFCAHSELVRVLLAEDTDPEQKKTAREALVAYVESFLSAVVSETYNYDQAKAILKSMDGETRSSRLMALHPDADPASLPPNPATGLPFTYHELLELDWVVLQEDTQHHVCCRSCGDPCRHGHPWPITDATKINEEGFIVLKRNTADMAQCCPLINLLCRNNSHNEVILGSDWKMMFLYCNNYKTKGLTREHNWAKIIYRAITQKHFKEKLLSLGDGKEKIMKVVMRAVNSLATSLEIPATLCHAYHVDRETYECILSHETKSIHAYLFWDYFESMLKPIEHKSSENNEEDKENSTQAGDREVSEVSDDENQRVEMEEENDHEEHTNNIPIRRGVVIMVEDDQGTKRANIVNQLLDYQCMDRSMVCFEKLSPWEFVASVTKNTLTKKQRTRIEEMVFKARGTQKPFSRLCKGHPQAETSLMSLNLVENDRCVPSLGEVIFPSKKTPERWSMCVLSLFSSWKTAEEALRGCDKWSAAREIWEIELKKENPEAWARIQLRLETFEAYHEAKKSKPQKRYAPRTLVETMDVEIPATIVTEPEEEQLLENVTVIKEMPFASPHTVEAIVALESLGYLQSPVTTDPEKQRTVVVNTQQPYLNHAVAKKWLEHYTKKNSKEQDYWSMEELIEQERNIRTASKMSNSVANQPSVQIYSNETLFGVALNLKDDVTPKNNQQSDNTEKVAPLEIIRTSVLNKKQRRGALLIAHEVATTRQAKALIVGTAGTGKSFMLGVLVDYFTAIFGTRQSVKIVAHQGCAAANVGGQTIHSLVNLNFKSFSPEQEIRLATEMLGVKVLVIEEVYMVNRRTFYQLSDRLTRALKNDLPFGGLHVICLGDPFQLEPVKKGFGSSDSLCLKAPFEVPLKGRESTKKNERGRRTTLNQVSEGSQSDYGRKLFLQFEKVIYLTESQRQAEDQLFFDILQHIKRGTATEEMKEIINARCADNIPDFDFSNAQGLVHDNKLRHDLNRKTALNIARAEGKEDQIVYVIAKDVSNGTEVTSKLNGELKALPATSYTKYLPGVLPIFPGAKVMLFKNLDVSAGITNGLECTVVSYGFKPTQGESKKEYKVKAQKNEYEIVYVSSPDIHLDSEILASGVTQESSYLPNQTIPIFPISESGLKAKDVTDLVSWTRKQFPIDLAYWITVHKAQGKTFAKIIIGPPKNAKNLDPQWLFVALSRCRSLKDFVLLWPIPEGVWKQKPKEYILAEDRRLKKAAKQTKNEWKMLGIS